MFVRLMTEPSHGDVGSTFEVVSRRPKCIATIARRNKNMFLILGV
jgi:hypothetical protein